MFSAGLCLVTITDVHHQLELCSCARNGRNQIKSKGGKKRKNEEFVSLTKDLNSYLL